MSLRRESDGGLHIPPLTSESGLLDLDLRKGTLVADAEVEYATSATSFEHASLFARRVVLRGTDGRNDLRFSACDANVSGRGGSDTMARSYDSFLESVYCPRFQMAYLNGGSGKTSSKAPSARTR